MYLQVEFNAKLKIVPWENMLEKGKRHPMFLKINNPHLHLKYFRCVDREYCAKTNNDTSPTNEDPLCLFEDQICCPEDQLENCALGRHVRKR